MQINGQCPQLDPAMPIPPGARSYGGQCEQFGVCRMWECPDFFPVAPGYYAYKWSDQFLPRYPFGLDWYVLGDLPLNFSTNANQNLQTVFDNTLENRTYTPKIIDFGSVYASRTFTLEDGRLVWIGWVFEASQVGISFLPVVLAGVQALVWYCVWCNSIHVSIFVSHMLHAADSEDMSWLSLTQRASHSQHLQLQLTVLPACVRKWMHHTFLLNVVSTKLYYLCALQSHLTVHFSNKLKQTCQVTILSGTYSPSLV